MYTYTCTDKFILSLLSEASLKFEQKTTVRGVAKLACVETKSDGRKKLGRKDAQGVLPSFQAMPFSAPAKIHHPRAHNANTATNTTARLVKSASLWRSKRLMTLSHGNCVHEATQGGALIGTSQAGLGDNNYGVIYMASMWWTSNNAPFDWRPT